MTSNTAAVPEYGAMMPRNSMVDMPVRALRYRLCALPIGVSILPTFAPMVISVTTRMVLSSCPAMMSTATANGTNVTSATSLVMNIAEKNVKATSVMTSPRMVLTFSSNREPMMRNTPIRWNPHTTIIRQMSWLMVLA